MKSRILLALLVLVVLVIGACTVTGLDVACEGSGTVHVGDGGIIVTCGTVGGSDAAVGTGDDAGDDADDASDVEAGGSCSESYTQDPAIAAILVGDSTTAGSGDLTTYANIYASTFFNIPWGMRLNPSGGTIYNEGVGGDSCAQILARATADASTGTGNGWASLGTDYEKRWLVVYCGYNDGSASAATQWDTICQIADVGRAHGMTRVSLVVPTDTNLISTAASTLASLRTLIRANARASDGGTCGDEVIDLAADPLLGATNAHLNTHLFADGLHMTHEGHWYEAKYHFDPAFTRAKNAP